MLKIVSDLRVRVIKIIIDSKSGRLAHVKKERI